jgi:hypothetical protein
VSCGFVCSATETTTGNNREASLDQVIISSNNIVHDSPNNKRPRWRNKGPPNDFSPAKSLRVRKTTKVSIFESQRSRRGVGPNQLIHFCRGARKRDSLDITRDVRIKLLKNIWEIPDMTVNNLGHLSVLKMRDGVRELTANRVFQNITQPIVVPKGDVSTIPNTPSTVLPDYRNIILEARPNRRGDRMRDRFRITEVPTAKSNRPLFVRIEQFPTKFKASSFVHIMKTTKTKTTRRDRGANRIPGKSN